MRITFVLLGLSLGCAHAQTLGEPVRSGDAIPLVVESDCHEAESDHISVVGAELTSSTLRLRVRHGGGCEEHSYRLCPDPVVLRTEPGVQRLVVVHDANGDMCEAELDLTLETPRDALPRSVLDLANLEDRAIAVSVD